MRKIWLASICAASCSYLSPVFAASLFDTGIIQLGVVESGNLGVAGPTLSPVEAQEIVGLRYVPTGNEALSHGCICEGWGAGNGGTGTFGYASYNNSENLTSNSFEGDLQTAVAVNVISDELRVSHSFAPSGSANLYEMSVSLTNVSAADMTDLRYTRTIDWDIEPTAFNEVLSFGGVSAAASLLRISTAPNASPNPFGERDQIVSGSSSIGPGDLGTTFDFAFGTLRQGETLAFKIYYGAAENQALALTALGSVAAELFAIASAACDTDVGGIGCAMPSNAFMVGFSGVGGTPISTGDVPIPAGLPLLLSGLLGLAGLSRKRASEKSR